jgi:hypothetical protein
MLGYFPLTTEINDCVHVNDVYITRLYIGCENELD